jgi:hypothetical protein
MDVRFRTWNRILYRSDSLKTLSDELEKYNLGLVAVQEFGLGEDDSQPVDHYTFSMEM